MKKNLWKKFLAGFSAAVMLVTSLGAMPIVSATGTVTNVVGPITFEDWEAKTYSVESAGKLNTAPANQIFYDSDADATITVAEDNGDKYATLNRASGNRIYYRPEDNTAINLSNYKAPVAPSETGDQFVISGEFKSGTTAVIGGTIILPDAVDKNGRIGYTYLRIENTGLLKVTKALSASPDQDVITLPTGGWYGIDLVYTVGDSANSVADTVAVYVNGVLRGTYNMTATDIPKCLFNKSGISTGRLELEGVIDNLSIRTFTGGATFSTSDATKYVKNVVGPITFEDWELGAYTNANKGALNEAPVNQIFNDPDGDATITVAAENGDKYATLNRGGSNRIYYKTEDNAAINSSNYKAPVAPSETGDQFVISGEFKSGTKAVIGGTIILPTATSNSGRFGYTYLTLENTGLLKVTKAQSATSDQEVITLPTGEWYGIDLVYTVGDSTNSAADTVAVYVNGVLRGTYDMTATDIPKCVFNKSGVSTGRLELEGVIDNLSIRTFTNGSTFTTSDATTVPQVYDIVDLQNFDGAEWVDGVFTGTKLSLKSGKSVDVIEDAEGDKSIKMTNAVGDAYFNKSELTNNTGLLTGDQLVFSTELHTATTVKVYPLVHAAYKTQNSSTRVYHTLFEVANGIMTHYDGGYRSGFAETGTQNSPLVTVGMPKDQWVKLDIVYTKKVSTIDMQIYVNGHLRAEEELIQTTLLDGPFERIELGTGHFDNLSIKSYRGGARFDASALAKTHTTIEHTGSTNLTYTAIEYLVEGEEETPHNRGGQRFGTDLDGVYGKASGDKAIEIAKAQGGTYEGDYDLTGDEENPITEDGYTISKVNKRISSIDAARYGSGEYALPVNISFDIFAKDANFAAVTLSGRVIDPDGVKSEPKNILNMRANDNGVSVGESIIGYKEWHNIAMKFIPGSNEYTLYIDGTPAQMTLPDGIEFGGFDNLYIDFSGEALIDNYILKTGDYAAPAQPVATELTVAEDAEFGLGNKWDGSKLITNKYTNGLPFANIDTADFTSEGNTVIFINADGAVVTAETENGTIDQIVVRDANGYIHYWKVVKRTGTAFIEDYAEDKVYLLDVANGSNYTSESVTMFVVTYTDAEKIEVSEVALYTPTVEGDTLTFTDVTYDSAVQSLYVLHNGTLAPLK